MSKKSTSVVLAAILGFAPSMIACRDQGATTAHKERGGDQHPDSEGGAASPEPSDKSTKLSQDEFLPRSFTDRWRKNKTDSTAAYNLLFKQFRTARQGDSDLDPLQVGKALRGAAQAADFSVSESIFYSTALDEDNVNKFVHVLHALIVENATSLEDDGAAKLEALAILGMRLARWSDRKRDPQGIVTPIVRFAGLSCLDRTLSTYEKLALGRGDAGIADECSKARQNVKDYTDRLREDF